MAGKSKVGILDELNASAKPGKGAWLVLLSEEATAGLEEVREAWRAGKLKHLDSYKVSRFLKERFALSCTLEAVRKWLLKT